MGLPEVVTAFRARVAGAGGAQHAFSDPLPTNTPDRSLVVYGLTRDSNANAQSGENGGIAVEKHATVAVEYHRRVAAKDWATVLPDVTATADALLDAIWGGVGSDFDGTVFLFAGVRTEHTGELTWGTTFCFGARLLADVSYLSEVTN